MALSKQLTIFEGCDGSGKSRAAQEYARQVGAKYVHFPALPRVKKGLGRMYIEAMLPALLGYQPVVFDRCWLSEVPYGVAFREGQDRLTNACRRMLERVALRCGAVVIHCSTSWEQVLGNYRKRKGQEMLRNETQLRDVWDMYRQMGTHLPVVSYDFTQDQLELTMNRADDLRYRCHPLEVNTAGNHDANIVLVGESFAERKDQDAWYQAPFVSFSGDGCSRWLTDQLVSIPEHEILWVNADQDLSFLMNYPKYDTSGFIYALGAKAAAELYKLKIRATVVEHPQHHKRFHATRRYDLIDALLGD